MSDKHHMTIFLQEIKEAFDLFDTDGSASCPLPLVADYLMHTIGLY
jgi:Ca2+-binding EF-hand superfamily protein